MDIKRYLLIAASVVLVVMLLNEWNAFKADRATDIPRERISDVDIEALSPVERATNTSIGGIPMAEVALGEDIPNINLGTNDSAAIVESAQHNHVRVLTDTLDVVIDLDGGDIVELALRKFPEAIDAPDIPFMLLEQNTTRTYIAQSGLVGPNGIDNGARARYQASAQEYQQKPGEALQVDLQWIGDGSGVRVNKQFTFSPDSYIVDINYQVHNNSQKTWQAVPFAQLKRDNSAAPNADNSGFGLQPFLGAALTQPDERFTKLTFADIADEPFKKTLPGGWIAMMQHYFVSAWIPNPDQNHNYSTRHTSSGFNIVGFTSPAVTVNPGESARFGAKIYAGPKDQYSLAAISPHLDLTVDYGWLWWIAQPLFWLLTQIQSVVQNWGVAIILLTVLVKGAFFRLSAASYRSMAKMRKVQPKMQSIREQYGDDKQKQSQAMMELYKKEKINPMGGCLPILIQMPVFISLYWVLMESVELRQAPFALWINDLSVMDPYFVLPLMMGASMFFMQKLNPPPPDPMQAKIMQWLPVMFTFFFLWFPAGLVLYWVCNNLLSMTQQWVITRRIEAEGN